MSTERPEQALGRAISQGPQSLLNAQIASGAAAVDGAVKARMAKMVQRGAASYESLDKYAGINEEEILSFVPDRRDLSGIGPLLLGLLVLVLLPGAAKLLALLFFAAGILLFLLRYVNAAKIDVPDGYQGVVCRFGSPVPATEAKASTGRNWCFNYAHFIPYLVSLRDQVVNLQNANFTGDFGSISLSNQVVFKVEDPAKFISRTSPAGIMKILNLYASYITLRMITSMPDARVKFVGRDRIDNVIQALNQYLAPTYGIRVIRANMPSAENDIIKDLEEIRTRLKMIDVMNEDKQVKLENAIKEVESIMRKARKETRSRALELQHAKISLETRLAEEVNIQRQALLIEARRELEEKLSLLRREMASVRAKLEKSRAIRQSFVGLEAQLELRKAGIRRQLYKRLVPQKVSIFGVDGMGAGVGLSLGQKLFGELQRASEAPSVKAPDSGKHNLRLSIRPEAEPGQT